MEPSDLLVEFSASEIKFTKRNGEKQRGVYHVQNRSGTPKKLKVALTKDTDKVTLIMCYVMTYRLI